MAFTHQTRLFEFTSYQRSCDLTPGKHKLFPYGQGDSDYCNIFCGRERNEVHFLLLQEIFDKHDTLKEIIVMSLPESILRPFENRERG